MDNEALKSAIRLGWDSVVALLLDDDRVRRTIKDFGALIDVAGRASVRRKLTRAMRESTVKAIVLVGGGCCEDGAAAMLNGGSYVPT